MAIKFTNMKTQLELNDVFPFGKYADSTVQEVLSANPAYLTFLTSTGIKFAHSVLDALKLHDGGLPFVEYNYKGQPVDIVLEDVPF